MIEIAVWILLVFYVSTTETGVITLKSEISGYSNEYFCEKAKKRELEKRKTKIKLIHCRRKIYSISSRKEKEKIDFLKNFSIIK